jgi:DNA adenine methylase
MKNNGKTTAIATPFLKWAGGKRQLLPKIIERLPKSCATYYEPFVGGGAVFFALAGESYFRRAIISDTSKDLLIAYRGLKADHHGVVEWLELAEKLHGKNTYYSIRSLDPRKLTLAQQAARTIYLNRTCFNGLYRVNQEGRFNVPFGRYKNPRIVDALNLKAVSTALRRAKIVLDDFETVAERAIPGDVVYFDPPYIPVSRTSSFTAYAKDSFSEKEQRRLADLMHRLKGKGVFALLSNADVPLARELYDGLRMETVLARRAINSKSDRRGTVRELLVSTD